MLSYELQNDNSLMTMVRDKADEEAFEELFKRHRKKTLAILRYLIFLKHKTSYTEDPEDLTQLVWAKIWRYRYTFKEAYNFLAWHRKITYNVFNDVRRGNKGPIMVTLDETNSPLTEKIEQFMPNCMRAWSRLKPEYQEVLKALYLEGLSRKEIGERMGKSQPTIREMIKRAKEEFRQKLADEGTLIDAEDETE